MDDPDVALMLAFAGGNEQAFVDLYNRHRDRILNYTRRMLGNASQAEEATQDVFLKLYRARDSYAVRSRFSTFLYRIATNHCLNLNARVERKLVRRDVEAANLPGSQHADQQHALEQAQLREALAGALSTLPERQRAALLLVHYEGMSYREAADTIDVSEGAIKSLVHRARGAMIEALKTTVDGEGAQHAM